MKLKISSFADAGQQSNERLVIRAETDADVGEYLVMCSSTSSEGNATAGRKVAYWFPDKEVKSGDLVVLYSKSGTQSEKKLQSGATAHFFYWGVDKPLWVSGNGAVLLLALEWKFEVPGHK
jgi:hypothetical protein